MTTRISQYLGGHVANWLRGTVMPSAPGTVYLALSSTEIYDNATGITELTGGYARQAVTFTSVAQSEGSGSIMSNAAPVLFTGLNATVATHFAIFDAASGGNMLFYGPLAAPIGVSAGGSASFATGVIAIQYAGLASHYFGGMILNWVRGTTAPAAPVSLNLAHSLTPVMRSGSGLNEPSGGYSRQQLVFSAPTFTSGTGTAIVNTNNAIFGPATVVWGPLTHVAVLDQAGNLIVAGELAVSFSVTPGEGRGVNIGAFSLTVR